MEIASTFLICQDLAKQAGLDDLGVVEDECIAGCEQRREIAHHPVGHVRGGVRLDEEKPASVARAPLANSIHPVAMSSTSMPTWATSPAVADTRLTGPRNQSSRSMVWMPWFMSAPPPSSFQVPFQEEVV